VVRILYERWDTLPDFQRTRGALRILGLVLADLYANNRMEPLILPSHLSLEPGDLRNELVRVLDNSTFNNVVDSDIAGTSAKAPQIDSSVGREHARFQPAKRTATTIFL
jgi:predicted AAA+ superfamily ATPase